MIPISIYKSKVENTGPNWSGPVVQVAFRSKNWSHLLKRIHKDGKAVVAIVSDVYMPNYCSSTEKQWKITLLHVRPTCPGHIRVVKNRLLCSSDIVLLFYIHEMVFRPVILRQNWNKWQFPISDGPICHFLCLFIIIHWSVSRKLQKIRLWLKTTSL